MTTSHLRPRPAFALPLALALLAPWPALAQDPIKTAALEGSFEVQVTSSSVGRTLAPEAELDVSSHGRVRLRLDGKRVRLARFGDTLYGWLPAVAPGLAGALEGGGGLPAGRLRLRIRGADELAGTIRSGAETTRLVLRRAPGIDEALVEKARRWIMARAGDGDDDLFPAPDSGESGLEPFLLTGAAAERAIAFTKAWHAGDPDVEAFRLDPARQVVIALNSTFDEEDLYCAVLDRDTGEGRLLGESMGVVDLSYTLDQQTLDRVLPGAGDIDGLDHYDLIDRLQDGGAFVDLSAEGFAQRHWSRDGAQARFFWDEDEWQAWYTADAAGRYPEGRWLYLDENEVEFATFTCGEGDLWHVRVKVTRATGAVEVIAEH